MLSRNNELLKDKQMNKEAVIQKDEPGLKKFLQDFIAQKQAMINKAYSEINSNPQGIFELDKLLGFDPDRKIYSDAEANAAFEIEEEWGFFKRYQASNESGKKGDWVGLSGKGEGKTFDEFGGSIPDNPFAVNEITRKSKSKRLFFESLDEHFTKSDYVILNLTNIRKNDPALYTEAMDYIINNYGSGKLINITK